jgi:hypothetical protein
MQPVLQWKSNKYYLFRKCVFVVLGMQREMRRNIICGFSGSTTFFYIIS